MKPEAKTTINQDGKVAQPHTTIKRITVDDLKIHPVAQRKIVLATIKKLSENFSFAKIGVLTAVLHSSSPGADLEPHIVDGQHRVVVMRKLGFGSLKVWVMIHMDVQDTPEACEVFIGLNDRSVVRPYAMFRAELEARRPTAIAIDRIVRECGLEITDTPGEGHVVCASALKRAYTTYGGDALRSALSIALRTWGMSQEGLEGRAVVALSIFDAKYRGEYDVEALTRNLAKLAGGPAGLIGTGKTKRGIRQITLPQAMAESIVEIYNSGRRSSRLKSM
jgi:hypothetical protein